MNINEKIINFLKNTLLANIVIFIMFAPFSKKAIKISLLIALFLLIAIKIAEFGSDFFKHLITKIPIAIQLEFFWVALLISTIFSLDPNYSQSVLLERYLGYILFFLLGSYLVKERGNIIFLVSAILCAGIVLGAGGIWDHFHSNSIRLMTSYGQSVSLARFFVLYIPLSCIVLFFFKNKIMKIIAFVGLAFLLPCLIFNAARAAWVAVAGSLLILSFSKNRKIACGLLICIILIGLFLPLQLKQRAITTVDPLTWGERVPLWKISLKIFGDFPIFGPGLGMHEKLFSQYWKPSVLFPEFRYWDVHNNYLEIASESGIVGLVAFVWIFIVFFKHVFSAFRKTSGDCQIILMGLTISVIAVLIFALSASNITSGVQEAAVFWFILGMASGLSSLIENQEKIA